MSTLRDAEMAPESPVPNGELILGPAGALRTALGDLLLALLARLLLPEREKLLVLGGLSLGLGLASLLHRKAVTLALQGDRCDKALDLGRLTACFLAFSLRGELAANHILAHVILLSECEKLANLRRTLRTQAAGNLIVGQTGDFLGTLLDDDHVQYSNLVRDNATTARLAVALALAHAVATAALVTLGHHQPYAVRSEHTLLHRETLLILPSQDLEDVPSKLIAKVSAINLSCEPAVVERPQLLFILNLEHLLTSRRRIRDVQLHRNSRPRRLCPSSSWRACR
mmetsp:Transcript_45411/g.96639  ORF Transcript_45411/g.96639 Transcript_45411/m.96639 type:complete len:284 (+) Transcript_45411:174-1025(+)